MFFHAHCFQFLCRPWLPCSPLAPLGPIFPGDPAGPWSPLRPLSPCAPTDPLSPGGPAGPWSPLAPSLPLSPGTPGTPLVEVLMTVGHWRVAYQLMISKFILLFLFIGIVVLLSEYLDLIYTFLYIYQHVFLGFTKKKPTARLTSDANEFVKLKAPQLRNVYSQGSYFLDSNPHRYLIKTA